MDMDFGVSAPDLVAKEFLAVVLAGFGNELVPLTSDHGEEPCPKALLPIGNKPMLGYPLSWLDQSGVTNVLLICPSAHRPAISHYIHSSTSFSSLRIDLQTYDESQDLSIGTCAIIRHFSNRITDDFILVPCDFIAPPSLPLTKILNKFRTESTSDGAIASACWFESQNPHLGKDAIPEEWGSSSSVTPIVWDDSSGTLLHINTPDDEDHNGEEVELRMALLSKYPRTKLSSKYQDSHVYVCRRSVLDALQQKHHMGSFREEFFPWLCKVQYQRIKRNKYDRILSPASIALSQSTALRHSTLQPITHEHASATFSPTASPYLGTMALSAPPSVTDSDNEDAVPMSLRIGVVIHKATDGYVARANNLQSFLSLSRHFLTDGTYTLPTDPKNRSLIDQKATISSDSLIGDSTRVEERTSIKKSVIGKHCVIGKMVKITGCVLMDHCVVADGAKLDGSILGMNTKVGTKAELTRCVTQAGYEVEEGESFKHEKLDISDWTAATEESEESDEEDEEESEDGGAATAKDHPASSGKLAVTQETESEVAGSRNEILGSTGADGSQPAGGLAGDVKDKDVESGSAVNITPYNLVGSRAEIGEVEAGKRSEASSNVDDTSTRANSQINEASSNKVEKRSSTMDETGDEDTSDEESSTTDEESSAADEMEDTGGSFRGNEGSFREATGCFRAAEASILPAEQSTSTKTECDAVGSAAGGGRGTPNLESDQAHPGSSQGEKAIDEQRSSEATEGIDAKHEAGDGADKGKDKLGVHEESKLASGMVEEVITVKVVAHPSAAAGPERKVVDQSFEEESDKDEDTSVSGSGEESEDESS